MKKYLLCDLPRGGFGAILDRRIVVSKIAENYNREVIFRIGDNQYDDPFEWTYDFNPQNIDKNIIKFDYTNQKDSIVYFDHQHWLESIWIPSKRKRTPFTDGKIFNSYKLKNRYQKIVDDTLKKYPLIKESISLHIRRGDISNPITGHGKYTSLESLVQTCLDVINVYGKRPIYLNSDSVEAIHEVGRMLDKHNIQWFYDDDEIRYNGENWKIVLENPNLKIQETLVGIKIIYTMSESFHIVGANNVQFPKLASFLLSYRSNGSKGFTYVDWETEKKSYTLK